MLLKYISLALTATYTHTFTHKKDAGKTINLHNFLQFQGNENLTRKALFAYDAVWALSEALDAVKSDVHSFDPFNVSHENRLIGEEIRDSIRNVTYTGPTVGKRSFLNICGIINYLLQGELDIKDGSRAVNEIRVLQYRGK